jgi:fibronectin-binding autotransporter adhesin
MIATVTVNGQRGNIVVSSNGILKGTGTVGSVQVLAGGRVEPGNSPGCLNTGNLGLASGTTYAIEINGATVCTQYDRTNVTGTVSLGGATLSITKDSGYSPIAGASFTIIQNDGSDAVSGTFAGLAEGATFENNGVSYRISYAGGDGNDVVLTVGASAPDTGSEVIMTLPIMLGVTATFGMAGTSLVIARKLKK